MGTHGSAVVWEVQEELWDVGKLPSDLYCPTLKLTTYGYDLGWPWQNLLSKKSFPCTIYITSLQRLFLYLAEVSLK